MQLPKTGKSKDEVFAALADIRKGDLKWQEGRAFGYVFDPGEEIMDIGKKAYMMFLSENGLDFTVFKSLQIFEKQLARFAASHLGGDADVVGNFSSGGTESIILAVKTARDYARATRPEITAPEMILPTTGHSAFHKAAHYLDVHVVPVSVAPDTFTADPEAMRRAITPNTIMMVGSAPSYAHGVVDPIAALSDIAVEHGIWLHTDACMGGFLLPYFKRLGEPVPDFDFSLPGVSSMSVDLHKYAYCPKGASIVLYRNKQLRQHQLFACSSWVGYTMINNAIQSSKSGGPMAAAWAVLNTVGDDGFMEIARKKLAATKKIIAGIKNIPGLRSLAKPDMCLVSFTADDANIFHIIDEMNARGWYIQPALSFDNSPAHIHLSISASNVGKEDALLADLAECVVIARTLPDGDLVKLVREGAAGIDFANMSPQDVSGVLALAGLGGDGLPARTADINGVLDMLPPNVREMLLTAYVNDLFT
ncbi:MAG: aspartate aminotransferase family protein [Pseudomonadota bacterium]